MKYLYLNDDAVEENKCHYNAIYEKLALIDQFKADIIFKSSIPRLKQTNYRGIQAFKQLLKRFNNGVAINYNEALKSIWLKCFKLYYKYEARALCHQNNNCIIINDIVNNEIITELTTLEEKEFYINEMSPDFKHIGDEDDIIEICKNFIIDSNLSKDQIIKLMITLLN